MPLLNQWSSKKNGYSRNLKASSAYSRNLIKCNYFQSLKKKCKGLLHHYYDLFFQCIWNEFIFSLYRSILAAHEWTSTLVSPVSETTVTLNEKSVGKAFALMGWWNDAHQIPCDAPKLLLGKLYGLYLIIFSFEKWKTVSEKMIPRGSLLTCATSYQINTDYTNCKIRSFLKLVITLEKHGPFSMLGRSAIKSFQCKRQSTRIKTQQTTSTRGMINPKGYHSSR